MHLNICPFKSYLSRSRCAFLKDWGHICRLRDVIYLGTTSCYGNPNFRMIQGRTGLSGIRAMPEAPLEKEEFGAPKFPKRRPSF